MKTLFLVKNGQLALLLCGFLCVLDAQAVNWEIDSNLYARGILKDNVYLQVKNEESAKAVSISPNIIFQGRTALSKFDITTLLKQVRYTEDELES